MYREAMGYLREALDLHVEFNLAAKELASAVANLQAQDKASSAFGMGEELRSAGLVDQAIRSYKKLLAPEKQQAAEKAWNVVLGITTGDRATEYLNLARFYGEALLYNESLSLYQLAVIEGSKEAAPELRKIQQAAAARLTEAGKRLCALGHYDAAETFLQEALVRFPGYQRAINQMAIVEQNRPPREDEELLAQLRLGNIYEERGALEQAIPHYEAALKRDPQNAAARVALARIMDAWQSLHERYSRLLGPASLWLGLQIARRQLLARVPLQYRFRRRRYVGRVHNVIGLLAQTCGNQYPGHEAAFSHVAIEELRAATAAFPRHWLPWSNLADAQRQMSQILQATDADASAQWHEAAIASYNRALELARRPHQRREIMAAMGLAYLVRGDKDTAHKLIAEVEPNEATWGIAGTADSGLLFNLAAYYSLASRLDGFSSELDRKARRYLALGLTRDRRRQSWDWVDVAPEFASLGQGLKRVKDEIAFEQARDRKIHKAPDLSGFIMGSGDSKGILDRSGWTGRATAPSTSSEVDEA
jgi:tetratricopeptide (TPR) repeat protein